MAVFGEDCGVITPCEVEDVVVIGECELGGVPEKGKILDSEYLYGEAEMSEGEFCMV